MDNKIIIAPLKAKITKIVAAAQEVVIKTKEDLVVTSDILGKIKSWGKDVENARKTITDPLNASLKAARELFSPIEAQGKEAERIVKDKMLAFQLGEEEKARVKTEKIEAKVESGKMSFEKAAEKIEGLEPEKTVVGEKFSVQFRETRTVEIVDERLIPREYLVPDMVAIRRDVLAGKSIAGVEVKIIKTPVSSGIRK